MERQVVTPQPLLWLRHFQGLYPDFHTEIDASRPGRDWPDWCYAPLEQAWGAYRKHAVPRLETMTDVAALSALAAWRVTKGIYRFDPELGQAIMGTPLEGELPGELLLRLPEWCVYLEWPSLTTLIWGQVVLGCFAYLDYDTERPPIVRIIFDIGTQLVPVYLELKGSLEESLRRNIAEAGEQIPLDKLYPPEQAVAEFTGPLSSALSLLLYLCSEEPDITPGLPVKPKPKKVKGGEKLFAAKEIQEWQVAWRLGAAIRAAREQSEIKGVGTHASPRPHIRRAHWHSFRAGKERRETRVKWLPPIAVNLKGELPAVIRRVED